MNKKLMFCDMTDHVKNIFDNSEDNFEGYRNLLHDLANGVEIFDADGKKISHEEAEKNALSVTFSILGLTKDSTRKQRKRALEMHGKEWFAVSEEEIDVKVERGFRESEFFNTFVESRNTSRGDSTEFYTEDPIYLSVVRTAGDFHDTTVQRLGSGTSYTLNMEVYKIATGADIDLYLSGRLDWSKFTDKCAEAFVRKIQNDMYVATMGVGDKLPAQFKGTGTLTASTKDAFDEVLDNVSIANNNSPLFIMGTKNALRKISVLADVDWISNGQKDEMASMGRLGTYEGTVLFEIPQRFDTDGRFDSDTIKKLVDSKKLLIMPQVDNKFIKFIEEGETEINEVTEKAARTDDTMLYEVERRMAVGVQLGLYFGLWELA